MSGLPAEREATRMKPWQWIILLLPVSPLIARDKKFGGYVLDAAAFRFARRFGDVVVPLYIGQTLRLRHRVEQQLNN
jgi:hypothetical protein